MVLQPGHKRYSRRQAMQIKELTDARNRHSGPNKRATACGSCMARRAFMI